MREKIAGLFRFLFATRKRAFWSVTGLIVLVVGLGIGIKLLNNRLDFLAFDGPPSTATEAGFGYVEDVTKDLFSQELTKVPSDQLSDYNKVAMVTDLAGKNYFRLNLATERQTFLNSWQPPTANWKTFAQTAETASTGAWKWLEWLKPYCGPDNQARLNIVGHALAQGFNPDKCSKVQKALFDPKISKIYTFAEYEIMANFGLKWQGFHDRAFANCRNPGTGHIRGTVAFCDKAALYEKYYWSSADLDTLYSKGNALGAFKSSRNVSFFSQPEVKQVTSHDHIAWIMALKFTDEITREQHEGIRGDAINIMLTALPIEGIVGRIFGFGGKALGLGADIMHTLPLGTHTAAFTGVALKTTSAVGRGAAVVVNIVLRKRSAYLNNASLNLSEWFGKSKITSYLRTADSSMTMRQGVATNIFEATAEYVSDKIMLNALVKRGLSQEAVAADAVKIFQKSKVQSARNFATAYGSSEGRCSAVACAYTRERYLMYDEEYMMRNLVRSDKTRSYIIDAEPTSRLASIVYHENNHLFIKDSSLLSRYSPNIKYRPLEEGGVEWNARRLSIKNGYSRDYVYQDEWSWYDELVAAIDRGQHKGIIKLKGTAEQIQADYLYAYGADALDELLKKGMPRGTSGSPMEISWIYFNAGKPKLAIDFMETLFQ